MRRTMPAAFLGSCWKPRRPKWPRRESSSRHRRRLRLGPVLPPQVQGGASAQVLPLRLPRRLLVRRQM